MNEIDSYILDAIRTSVWSGFCNDNDVQEMIDDIIEEEANESYLRSQVNHEFEQKQIAELSWPKETDCDRLTLAFHELNQNNIIALHNAGNTMSDGLDDVNETMHQRGKANVIGYCFYHGQDVERAVKGSGLWLAFGDFDANNIEKIKIGNIVKSTIEKYRFHIEWNEDSETRLSIPVFDWKRRMSRSSGKL
jgi:hypothetical protein